MSTVGMFNEDIIAAAWVLSFCTTASVLALFSIGEVMPKINLVLAPSVFSRVAIFNKYGA